jgi:hypothetical protein
VNAGSGPTFNRAPTDARHSSEASVREERLGRLHGSAIERVDEPSLLAVIA